MWGTLKLPQSLWLWSPLPLSWSGWARFLRPAGSDDGARAPTEGEQHTKNAHTTSNRTPQPLSPEADPFVQGGTLGEEQNVLREWSGVIQKAGRGEARRGGGAAFPSQSWIQVVFLLVDQRTLLRWRVKSFNVCDAFTPLVMSKTQTPVYRIAKARRCERGRKTRLFFLTTEMKSVLKHGRQFGRVSTPEGGRDRSCPATLCASSLSADPPFTESF